MRNTVNVIQGEIERGKPHGASRSPIRQLKSFGRPVLTVLPALLICLLVPMGHGIPVFPKLLSTAAFAQSGAQQSDAQKAFKQLKALAGNWEGPATMVPQMPEMSGNQGVHNNASGAGDPHPDKR